MDEKGCEVRPYVFILTAILLSILILHPPIHLSGEATLKPSQGWGPFFNTVGDVKIDITETGVAVKIEVPREFLEGTPENDTSIVESNISNDYYYYKVVDQSKHYPYDRNAPYTVEVWNPPIYLGPSCTGAYYNFTPPKYILLRGLKAPNIAGVYNFTVYIAKSMESDGAPHYPSNPDKVLSVLVSMRENPSHIYGYVVDETARKYIKAKGVVYAVEVHTGVIGRGFVDPATGFFNITGLYAGEYRLIGSASYYPETGYAYAVTETSNTYIVGKSSGLYVWNFSLNRGCVITGHLTYVDQYNNPIRPLDSPYLHALGYQGLNYTVEVYDKNNVIVASQTYQSANNPTESYRLIIRNGTKHVGYPALGTEYAGFGPGTYTVKIWVYGFTLPKEQMKTVTLSGYGSHVDVGESRLPYGAVVTGEIRLFASPGRTLETPKEAEARTYGSKTGKHFGGNILIEMYSSEGVLKGLTVLNRTQPDGVVQYADYSSGSQTPLLRFHILGFSEHYNKSYSGVWVVGSYPGPSPWDYGLEPGSYYIRVWIRGYVQAAVSEFTLGKGGNTTVAVDMLRGGATQVTVMSMTSKPRTRIAQAPVRWRFMDWCPPPRLRVYFTDSSGLEVGYAESILKPGSPGVTDTTATLNFTGHNWNISEIIYQGRIPNALETDNYSVKAYTYGYVQTVEVIIYISLSQFTPTSFPLIIGNRIYGSIPLTMNGLFVTLTENVTIRPQVSLDGDLKGVEVVNGTIGSSIFTFSTYGFYGRGHFHYVDPNGVRWKDYGLDVGNYTVHIPDFGYDRMFTQTLEVYANLPDLGYEVGVYYHIERMIKIYGLVTGETNTHPPIIPLNWATVEAKGQIAYTVDGEYALHLPSTGETVTVTYSIPGYLTTERMVLTNDQIQINVNLQQSGEPFP
ncbi:MAG: hypothetical protein QXO32_07445 [Candidatus Bathyarchaeia archaeon]